VFPFLGNTFDNSKKYERNIHLHQKRYFNIKEINELIAFYETPTGQKVLAKTPKIMKDAAMIGMKEAQNKQSKLMERFRPFIEKHKNK